MARPHGVGPHLPSQVDFDGTVDGRHLGVAADDGRVIHIGHVQHGDKWVVVHKIVKSTRSHNEGADDLAGVHALVFAGNDTPLHQVDHAIREHLGVDAQILVIGEGVEHGVGDAADAHLQTRAILDELGAVLADAFFGVGHLGRLHFVDGGVVHCHCVVDVADVDQPVAVGARHCGVHLRHHMAGRLHGGARHIHRNAQRAVAVFVGRGDLHQRHIQRHDALTEEAGDFAQEDGHIVGHTFIHGGADVGPHEEGVGVETLRHLRARIGGFALGVDADDLHVAQLFVAVGHGLHQQFGCGRAAMDKDAVPRFDDLYGFFNGFPLHLIDAPKQGARRKERQAQSGPWQRLCASLPCAPRAVA